jgi:iron complex outermembrane recepter protein
MTASTPRPRRRHRAFRLCALAGAIACPGALLAQGGEAQLIVVSGSRTAINANTPAATDSIDRSRLSELNIANPEDSIKYLPNIAVRKRFIGDRNAAIESRGTNNRQSARGLVLADGVLLSNFLGSQDQVAPRWSMVFPEEIDRVDVIYGPFSALYAGNAMGAVVLFTTRMPRAFEAHAGVQLQRQAFEFFGTDTTLSGNLANAFVDDRVGAWAYQLGVSRLDSTSHPTGFAALPLSTTLAQPDDPVAAGGFFPTRNRAGQDVVIVGVGGGAIERTQQSNVKFKLGYDIDSEWQARLTAIRWYNERSAGAEGNTTYLRDRAGVPIYAGPVNVDGLRYTLGAGTFAPRGGEEEHHNAALSLRRSVPTGWNVEAIASWYHFAKNVTRTATTAPPASFGGGPGTLNLQDGSGWRTLDVKLDRRPGDGQAHWFSVGAHYSRYIFRQDNFRTDDWRQGEPTGVNSIVRGHTDVAALYVQDAWSFTDDWKAILGLRAERWRSFDGRSEGGNPSPIELPDRSESALSPKLALEYAPAPDWLARLSLARATRFPTPVELFQGNVSAVQQITSDPNLKPERGNFLDFTIERYFGNASMRVTLYQEDTRDTLFNQTNAAVVPSNSNAQNIDRVRVRGIEFAADTRGVLHPKLDLSGSLAYNDSRVLGNSNSPQTVGNRFAQLPLTRGSLVAIWRHTPDFNVSAALRHTGKQSSSLANDDVVRNAFNGVSSFVVVDLRANVTFNRHAKLSLGVDNATDRAYFVNHPYPKRSLVAELKLSL